MKKKLWVCLPVAALLAFGAAALAEEGVRVAGSKLPYILGGIGAIAVGLLLTIGMASGQDGRTVVVTPTGLPIPAPLFPLLIGVVIGIGLFTATPKDSYTLGGIRYKLGKEEAAAVGFAKDAEVPEVLTLPAEVEGVPLTSVSGFGGTDIRELVLPRSLKNIHAKAFKDCASLTTVRVGDGNLPEKASLSVGDEAFSGCAALEDLSLPRSTGSVGNRAFMGCACLTRASFPGAWSVGDRAFSGCEALGEATLSANIRKIGLEAFVGCGALKSVRLEGVDERNTDDSRLVVGDRAFENCAALEVMEFPVDDHMKSVGERAFAGCAKLVCDVPSAHLEKYCFEGCASLRTVSLNDEYFVRNDRYTVPEGAFKDCSGLLVVNLSAIDSIGASAFEGCASLKQVSAIGVKSIKKRAFANCPALEVMGVSWQGEGSLKKPAKNAFEGSEKVVLYDAGSAKVSKVAEAAGLKSGSGWFHCQLLEDDTLLLDGWLTGEEDRTGVFTVPGEWCGLPVSAVDLDTMWLSDEYEPKHEEIVVEEGIRTLGEDCFKNWRHTLRRIRLPDSLETIESYRDSIVSDSDDMTVYTSNPVAIEYAERRHWTVLTP